MIANNRVLSLTGDLGRLRGRRLLGSVYIFLLVVFIFGFRSQAQDHIILVAILERGSPRLRKLHLFDDFVALFCVTSRISTCQLLQSAEPAIHALDLVVDLHVEPHQFLILLLLGLLSAICAIATIHCLRVVFL